MTQLARLTLTSTLVALAAACGGEEGAYDIAEEELRHPGRTQSTSSEAPTSIQVECWCEDGKGGEKPAACADLCTDQCCRESYGDEWQHERPKERAPGGLQMAGNDVLTSGDAAHLQQVDCACSDGDGGWKPVACETSCTDQCCSDAYGNEWGLDE